VNGVFTVEVEVAIQTGQIHRSLANVELFAEVRDETLQALEQMCAWQRYPQGKQIVGYLDDDSDVYFVIAGKCRVKIYSASGKVVGFRALGPGGMFGEFAAIDQRPRSASIEAEEESVVAKIPAVRFRQIIADEPAVSQALILHLVTQMRAITARVFEFSTLAVNNRIDAELLRLAWTAEAPPNAQPSQVCIVPAPTHAEIAARISTHREAVSRHMSKLTRMGLIKRRGRTMIIYDVERLTRMVETASCD
jgi:CRP/FNR family transcriptional regulator, cyclic AMP receptor protein